jgi:hypothetical protein
MSTKMFRIHTVSNLVRKPYIQPAIVLGLLIVFVGVYFVYLLLMWLVRGKE